MSLDAAPDADDTTGDVMAGLDADGWQPIRFSAFTSLIGPILTRRRGERSDFCFRVQPKHDNTEDRPHGGMIMAFADEAMGLAAQWSKPGLRMFTVSFDCQFIGPSLIGELVVAETEVVRATSTLVFMRCMVRVEDRVVAQCTGIWKVVKNRPEAA